MEGLEMRVETLEGVTPDKRWYREEKQVFDNKEAARRMFPMGVMSDGEPQHTLFEHLRGQYTSPKGHVQILNVPSSVFRVPLSSNKEAQVRAVGSLVNLLLGEYVQYIMYPRKRTSVKYDWTHTFGHIFNALEIDDDPYPLLVLMITSYRGSLAPSRYAPKPLTDPRHLELVQRMHTYWCNDHLRENAALFYELIHWTAATRNEVNLNTDYGPEGTFGDMIDIIRYFGKMSGERVPFAFPTKTHTFINLIDNKCSEELEFVTTSCSADPFDNVAHAQQPNGISHRKFDQVLKKCMRCC